MNYVMVKRCRSTAVAVASIRQQGNAMCLSMFEDGSLHTRERRD